MQYKTLGQTGLQVSQLCFGTMSFGGDADEAESAKMFHACRDIGINFFDCADAYSKGKAETILGKLIKDCRDEIVLTSKCFIQMDDNVLSGGAGRRHIIQACEASLKRLGTDYLDVFFMHRWSNIVPLEETLRALEKLVADGKVHHLGVSNYSAWQIAKALGIAEKNNWQRVDVVQPMYSLVKRQVEVEILELAKAENLGVMTYSPVGGGLLSGKYTRENRPKGGRISTNPEYTARYKEDWVFEVAEKFSEIANSKDIHPVSLAVAWAAKNEAITCPIIGARSLEQLQPSLDSIKIDMSDALYEELCSITRTPPPATDRLEEQG
jgi:aryl-alcohol dehydrogenase-like predicted oxidoreductase